MTEIIEPVASLIKRLEQYEIRFLMGDQHDRELANDIGRAAHFLAHTSSPAPRVSSLNSGESEPSVMPAPGAGEAIFEECAEIAQEHIMGDIIADRPGYDEACRDIAEAIKLRASNRKTMDAIADATLLKP